MSDAAISLAQLGIGNAERSRSKIGHLLGMGMGMGGNFFGENTIFLPITTARLYFLGPEAMMGIALKAPEGGDFTTLADEAEMLLVGRHRGVRG